MRAVAKIQGGNSAAAKDAPSTVDMKSTVENYYVKRIVVRGEGPGGIRPPRLEAWMQKRYDEGVVFDLEDEGQDQPPGKRKEGLMIRIGSVAVM